MTAPQRISVFGIGKVGSPLIAVLAAGGHEVIGVDVIERPVEALNRGEAPVAETDLQATLDEGKGQFRATLDPEEAIVSSDVTFVITPTPSQADGTFSNDMLVGSMEAIGRGLKQKDAPHLVVVCSTTVPGSMATVIAPALEAASGRKLGPDLGLCYSPMFIALGSVVVNIRRPDMVLIGESSAAWGEQLEAVLRTVQTDTVYQHMSFVNAEIAKLAVNTFVTTKISYANMLADICEHLDGADADVVTDAIGSDSRIGKKYLKGAVAYGGPCFPRDNAALAAAAKRAGADASLAEATDATNRHQTGRLARIVAAHRPEGGAVAVLGLSYKADTSVVEESAGLRLAQHLLAQGVEVRGHDPAAAEPARLIAPDLTIAATALEAIDGASVIVVATPWSAYKAIAWRDAPAVVIDCWRVVDGSALPDQLTLVRLGQGPKAP